MKTLFPYYIIILVLFICCKKNNEKQGSLPNNALQKSSIANSKNEKPIANPYDWHKGFQK